MIDPTCGSGHFLLGGVRPAVRAVERSASRRRADASWRRRRSTPSTAWTSTRSPWRSPASGCSWRRCRRAGIDRLRGRARLRTSTSPCGDSSAARRPASTASRVRRSSRRVCSMDQPIYAVEDPEALRADPRPSSYHAVVGNPPYITVKDPALNAAYRERYTTCHRQVLAGRAVHASGSSNWRSHGRGRRRLRLRRHDHGQLVHEAGVRQEADRGVLPADRPDPRHRHQRGLHPRPRHADGDPVRPQPAARWPTTCARCWASGASRARPTIRRRGWSGRSIVEQIDQPGSQSEFVSVADSPRRDVRISIRGASAAAGRRS